MIEPSKRGGWLSWMAANSVAANLLMFALILGGLFFLERVKWEVFPQFELELVMIQVPYPGASPAEVEQGVVLVIEEAVRSLDGIQEISSTASEGIATVAVELMTGTDTDRALSDIKSAIDRITTLPEDIERPIISLASNRTKVISLVIYGNKAERELRDVAMTVRDELLEDPKITSAELSAIRPLEVSINISRENLRRYGLTVEQVAKRIREASVELPSGSVKTQTGEVLVRTTERRNLGSEFRDIVLLSHPDGTTVTIGDVAEVIDGFRETDQMATFNGKRAAMVSVFRIGDQRPMDIADVVKDYIAERKSALPEGVELSAWTDRSEMLEGRTDLLLRNGKIGLCLVLLSLGLFLNRKLAFWVTLGIPISFVGSLILLPLVDVSLNMISLFAYIITLGIVVDDAIVVGEAIYKYREEGQEGLEAAINGVKEVATPVIFAIMTSIIAFMPMLFVPGASGKFFRVIPWVVITVLLLSLVESLLILPAHLAESKDVTGKGVFGRIDRLQSKFASALTNFANTTYRNALTHLLHRRYTSIAGCTALLLLSLGIVAGGRVNFTFLPQVTSDWVVASVEMPFGTSVTETQRIVDHLVDSAQSVIDSSGEPELLRGMFAEVGGVSGGVSGSPRGDRGAGGSHLGQVSVYMRPSAERTLSTPEFDRRWQEAVGEVAGVETLKFKSGIGAGSSQAPIDIRLSHANMSTLETAATELAEHIKTYEGSKDIDDGFSPGKEQLDLKLNPEARSLGLTELSMARQLRSSLFGAEAVRQQRGRDEVRVYVRLPREERRSEFDIEEIMLRTPQGGEIPLERAASIDRGRAYTSIKRVDARRAVTVSADVIPGVGNASKIVTSLISTYLPELKTRYPGLTYELGSQQKSRRRSLSSLGKGFLMALVAMFFLLAVAFKSYVRPIIIMLAIPFGLVGAIVGHVIMGFDLSMISMMGIVALSGIVVNDSLILIVAIDRTRSSGASAFEAAVAGGIRRFRPILLTSITTFLGLAPMIVETSVQARFLIPMAVSLGFGVLFATVITLVLVPAVYLALEDALEKVSALKRAWMGGEISEVG